MFEGTRLITDQQITNYIQKLANNITQKQATKEILEDQELQNDIEIDSCFIFERHHLLQILTILKTVLSVDTLRALLIVLTMIIKPDSALKTGRIEALQSSGIVDQIIDISIPMLIAKRAKGVEMALLCLLFFKCIISAGISGARKFVGEGTAPIFITMHEIISLEDDPSLDFVHICLDCLFVISEYHSLSLYLTKEHDVYTSLLMNTFESEISDEGQKVHEIRVLTMNIISNICKRSPSVLENVIEPSIVEILKNLIQDSAIVEERIAALRLYHTFLKGDSGNKLLDCFLPLVYSLCQSSTTHTMVKIVGLKCLRLATISAEAQAILSLFSEPTWLLDLYKTSTENQICKQSITVLHNLTSLSHNFGSKKFLSSLLLKVTDSILPTTKELVDLDILYHSLCIMCNLAYNDRIAQNISQNGQSRLMEQLIDYANHENQNIQKAALECIRNLCIDKQACLDIMELGYNQLIENLVQSKHITQTFQIIRNIWIQQKPCFFGFFNEPSFVDSLLSVLRSDDPDAQKASLDLVEYLINAKNEKYTTLLIQSNVIMSLRHLLLSTHKQKAAALFARVNLKDPWQAIEQGWCHKDKRRPKPMKPKSKKKSIY